MKRLAVLCLLVLAATSCRSSLEDDGTDVLTGAPSLLDRSVAGPFISIYATYIGRPPADRTNQVFVNGVHDVGHSPRHHALSMDVAKPALSAVLNRLRSLRWVTSIEVDSVPGGYLATIKPD